MVHQVWDRLRRRTADTEVPALVVLVASLAVLTVVGALRPDWIPYTSVLVPMFLASQWLGPRHLPWFTVLCLLALAVLVIEQPPTIPRAVLRILVVVVIGGLVLLASHRRIRLGVAGPRGEAMLVELRDRIMRQGRIDDVPDGWSVTSVLHSAGGTAFAGDFVVADVSHERDRLRVALVDVSGKGIPAGTRSLVLSGAMGGLLEALPAPEFLPAANRFLLGQDWVEGFATAVHLDLDLATGEGRLHSAGHPPAVLARASGPGWELLEPEGPALGLLEGAAYAECHVRLEEGDLLVLYTDGVVEHPRRDITEGIETLGARARDRLDTGGGTEAEDLIAGLGRRDDDRALLVVRRG